MYVSLSPLGSELDKGSFTKERSHTRVFLLCLGKLRWWYGICDPGPVTTGGSERAMTCSCGAALIYSVNRVKDVSFRAAFSLAQRCVHLFTNGFLNKKGRSVCLFSIVDLAIGSPKLPTFVVQRGYSVAISTCRPILLPGNQCCCVSRVCLPHSFSPFSNAPHRP